MEGVRVRMKKNRKIIIIGILVIIVIAFIIFVISNNRNKDSREEITETSLDISQVFEIEDIQKSQYKIKKAKDVEISSKYLTGTENYELDASVNFEDSIGRMYYVRESYSNLNIYQTEYKIDEYENISAQVEGIVEGFESKCKIYLGIEDSEKGKEELSGESTTKAAIPLGESIYYKGREYRTVYKFEDKTYSINFYKRDKVIVCELVSEK